jgi:hypothetical protein
MTGTLAAIATLSAVFSTVSAAPQPNWAGDYGAALQSTKASARPLLIVLDKPAEAASRVEQVGYKENAIGDSLLRPYQLCHVDVTTEYGKAVAQAFGAQQFPYTAIIDRRGSTIIYQKIGRFSTEDWAAALIHYKAGVYVRPQDCFT